MVSPRLQMSPAPCGSQKRVSSLISACSYVRQRDPEGTVQNRTVQAGTGEHDTGSLRAGRRRPSSSQGSCADRKQRRRAGSRGPTVPGTLPQPAAPPWGQTCRAIPGPVSKLKRRLDSLEAALGAPRDPRRDSRGGPSPWLPLETRPDSPGEPGMQPQDPCLPWRGILGPGSI